MADNIISGIHEQASMLPGHKVKRSQTHTTWTA